MPTIKIGDKDYDIEHLSDVAKNNLASLQFVQNELKRLQAQIAAFKTAEIAYSNALKEELPE
tara:strand:+ start:170 stop:355 length:186 start_codon:yes stop_codon:yes gene_type:complete